LGVEGYRALLDAMHGGVILQAASGEILLWNGYAERIFGINAEEIIGKKAQEHTWPTIREDGSPYLAAEHPWKISLDTGQPLNEVIMGVRRGGDVSWISVNSNPLARSGEAAPWAVAITFIDVTNMRREKTLLGQERDFIDRIMDTSPVGIIRTDEDGRLIYHNRRAGEILNWDFPNYALGVRPLEHRVISDFQGAPYPMDMLPFAVLKRTGKPVYGSRFALTGDDQSRILLSVNATPLFSVDGRFDGMVAMIDDVTEKIVSEQNYQMLFREMLDGFALHEMLYDEHGVPVDYRFLAVNPSFERLTGLRGEEILGRTILEVLPGTEQLWIERYGEVALTGKPIQFESFAAQLGRHFQVTAFCPKTNQFACIFTDVSERKIIEERLRQAEKMESIGSLAGGIAHDFNNLLSPIIGITEMLVEDLPEDSPLYEPLEDVHAAGLRGSELVKQILTFSRMSEHHREPVQPAEILADVLRLCRSTIPRNIELHEELATDLGTVVADRTELHQIAMNLITNAYHATEATGGIISVTLSGLRLPTESESVHGTLPDGWYACLRVGDTGKGIASEHLDKIFDPYFTTKEQGKGTGLGLAVVYGIVKALGGDIRVSSQPGTGTEFTVLLPMIRASAEGTSRSGRQPLERGRERVLVVDDELPIVTLEARILSRLGYQVVSRTSGIEAMKLVREDPDRFDLILTDMAMPSMTGAELIREVRRVRENMPIIICTGYSASITRESAAQMGVHYLMKPIDMGSLATMVRRALEGTAPRQPAEQALGKEFHGDTE